MNSGSRAIFCNFGIEHYEEDFCDFFKNLD